MFRNFVSLATLSLVLVFAAQAQGSTLLSYWPMNDGLSNSTATVCQNLGTLGSAYNATFGAAYSAGTSSLTPPGIALGPTSSGNLIGKPYGAGGYSSTYSALGGNSYTLPQWTTSGPFGYGLTFSGYNPAPIGTQSNNWGMNFVYVPGGSTTNAGQGGGGISGAWGATSANSNFAISMWVQWNGTQTQAAHAAGGGGAFAANAPTTSLYGPVMTDNFYTSNDFGIGLNGSSPSMASVAGYNTSTTVNTYGTPLSGWNNIVVAGGSSSVASTVYLNGRSVGTLPVGTLLTGTSQQNMFVMGGSWAYAWPTASDGGGNNSPWPNNGTGPTPGNSSMYLAPFNGSMADVGFFNNLSAGEATAIYNTPAVLGLSSYNLGDMDQLFALFETHGSPVTIGALTWQYVAALPTNSNQAWTDGSGDYYVSLSGTNGGAGVEALLVPEPSTLLLLAGGLTGLMAYAWKRRRRC